MRTRVAHLVSCLTVLTAAAQFDAAGAAALTLTTNDNRIELQLPDSWHQEEPDKPGWLKASSDNHYVMVISENKEDFSDIYAYASLVVSQMVAKLKDAKSSDAQKFEIGGRPALRYEITGTVSNGLRISYLLTIVETDQRFTQVLAWSLRSQFAASKDEFARLAEGLRELPAK